MTVPPGTYLEIDNDTTVAEVRKHIRDHHRAPVYDKPRNKAGWLAWHDKVHAADHQPAMKTKHTHQGLTVEEIKGVAEQLARLELSKPLGASEASALSKLIDNDFAALATDMKAMASDTRASRIQDLRTEWAAKGDRRSHYQQSVLSLQAKFNEDYQKLITAASEDGIKLGNNKISNMMPSAEIVGLEEAIKATNVEVDAELRRALLLLERQRISAQRVVILARVTPEAAVVLETIPSAQTLMLQAAAQREQQAVGV